MLLNLTEEQITQLAPDAPSVKAGRGLAVKSKWLLLEYSERAIWGHCQGSGKVPYQTVIDITNIAFKCSCPSHKFPCKHGLGLLYLYASHADSFQAAEEPEWVETWLAKREEKAEKKEQKAKNDTPVDEVAQAKRQAVRHQKILNGIDDLQVWMKDLLRNGLLNVPERVHALFENIARRMVDAQATGLAGRLRGIQEIDYYAEEWKYELTDKLSKIYLVSEGYKNLEKLSPDWQAEIRTQIGYPQPKEEVLAYNPIADRWMVLHKRSRKINELNTEMFWLYGMNTGRFALYLNFMTPGTLPEQNLLPGSIYEGELCFYQGVCGLRALFKSSALSAERCLPPFYTDLSSAFAKYRDTVRQNPLAEEVPVLVDNLKLVVAGKRFWVRDATGRGIPVKINETMRIDILAITGGKPFAAFLLADAACWQLKTIWYKSDYYLWKDELN